MAEVNNGVAPQPAASGGPTADAQAAPDSAPNAPDSREALETRLTGLLERNRLADPEPSDAPQNPAEAAVPGDADSPASTTDNPAVVEGAENPPEPETPESDAALSTEEAAATETPVEEFQENDEVEAEPASPKAKKRIEQLARENQLLRERLELQAQAEANRGDAETRRPEAQRQAQPSSALERVESSFDAAQIETAADVAQAALDRLDGLQAKVHSNPRYVESVLRKELGSDAPPEGQEINPDEMLDTIQSWKAGARRVMQAVPKRLRFLAERQKHLAQAVKDFPWLQSGQSPDATPESSEKMRLALIEFNRDPRWRSDPDADSKIGAIVEHQYRKQLAARTKAPPFAKPATSPAKPAGKPVTVNGKPAVTGKPAPLPRTTGGSSPPPRVNEQIEARYQTLLKKSKAGDRQAAAELLEMSGFLNGKAAGATLAPAPVRRAA